MLRAAFAVVLIFVGSASAEPWTTTRGRAEPGRTPGSFWLTTEAAPGRFSDGEVLWKDGLHIPYRIDVTWRRIGPEAGRSLHVTVADGVVLIRSKKIGFYAFDEAKFASVGWTPIPDYDAHAERTISVIQRADRVEVSIDGTQVAQFALATARAVAKPGVGLKGAPGFRSTLYVRSVTVTPL